MKVILLGYRGCGKTTIGKLLANQLWKDFVDSDTLVCERFGDPSVATIWEKFGQEAWRQMESEVVADLCSPSKQDVVIAMGGGVLTHPDGRRAIEEAEGATRIYLECDPEELDRRIQADTQSSGTRPPLTEHGGGVEEVRQVLLEREPAYVAVADKVFDVTHVEPRSAARYMIDRCLR